VTRIISGFAGSLRLDVPKTGTRPTSDRVREAIFSTLDAWGSVRGARVLDLYAGSGALGLEAVSRGAVSLVLVDKDAGAARVASSNAQKVTRASGSPSSDQLVVVKKPATSFLNDSQAQFDLIFLDPPYDVIESDLAANLNGVAKLASADAVVVVERSSRSPEPSWPAGLSQIRMKRYGETTVWFAQHAS